MTRTRIKICGITNAEDAAAAVAAGADAIGVVFAESPRQVTVDQAAAALAEVPPPVARIGVFVDADTAFVAEAVRVAGLTAVQCSGSESPDYCLDLPVPCIKVVRVGTDFGWESAEPYRGHAAALLLDTYHTHKAGGTGERFDWRSLGTPPGWAPFFVAGGISPENAAECVRVLRPFGIDVSSGVEASPGHKDPMKIDALCAAVRDADLEAKR